MVANDLRKRSSSQLESSGTDRIAERCAMYPLSRRPGLRSREHDVHVIVRTESFATTWALPASIRDEIVNAASAEGVTTEP